MWSATLTLALITSQLDSPAPGPGDAVAVIELGVGGSIAISLLIYDALLGGNLTEGEVLEPGYGNPKDWVGTVPNKTDPFMNIYNKPNLNSISPPPSPGGGIWKGVALGAALRLLHQHHKASQESKEFQMYFNTTPQDNTKYYNPKYPY